MSTVYYYLIQDSVPLQSDWITGLSSQGFLSVNNILKDPKTTQEPEHHLLDYSGLDDKTHLDKIVFEDEHENKNKREFFELGDIRDESSNERNYFSRSDVNPSLLVNKTKFLNKNLKFKFRKEKNPPKLNQVNDAQKASPRIKSDIALSRSEQNSSDFKHVMQYNQHFVPHLTKESHDIKKHTSEFL